MQVRLTETPRQLTGRGIRLRPGLVATAEIKTGRRSIASYILNPILRTADEGMRAVGVLGVAGAFAPLAGPALLAHGCINKLLTSQTKCSWHLAQKRFKLRMVRGI